MLKLQMHIFQMHMVHQQSAMNTQVHTKNKAQFGNLKGFKNFFEEFYLFLCHGRRATSMTDA